MNSRVRDNSRQEIGTWTVRETWVGQSTPIDLSGTRLGTSIDKMWDVKNSNFHRRSAAGEVIISPMEIWRSPLTFRFGTRFMTSKNNNWKSSGPYATGSASLCQIYPKEYQRTRDVIQALRAGSVTAAYAKVGSPDVALLTEIAELRETVQFLWSPVRGMLTLARKFEAYKELCDRILKNYERALQRYYKALAKWDSLPDKVKAKRPKPRKPKRPKLPTFRWGRFSGNDVASAWLAFRYGLMPLIYTFEDVQKLIKKRAEGPSTRLTARDKRDEVVDVTQDFLEPGNRQYDTLTYEYGTFIKGSVKVVARAGVLYEPKWGLSHQLGVTFDRVPVALWEAIPLSFVADWFQNGIEVYDALTAELRALKICGSWVTTEATGTLESGDIVNAISGGSASGHTTLGETKLEWRERNKTSLADVRFQLKIDMNGKRIADALALIKTILLTGRSKS